MPSKWMVAKGHVINTDLNANTVVIPAIMSKVCKKVSIPRGRRGPYRTTRPSHRAGRGFVRHLLAEQRAADAVQSVTATFQAVGAVSPTMTDDWWETVPFDGAVSSTMLVASEEEDCDLAELLALLVGAED